MLLFVCTFLSGVVSSTFFNIYDMPDFTNLVSGKKPNGVDLCLDDDQTVQDTFLSARVSWTNKVERIDEKTVCKKMFVLKLKKRNKRRFLQSYVQHIYHASEDIKLRCKELKLYMNTVTLLDDRQSIGRWSFVRLSHPATIETIAMDSDLKKAVCETGAISYTDLPAPENEGR
ncbi:hypothetical protein R6Q59_006483 [Mikania micrantha]